MAVSPDNDESNGDDEDDYEGNDGGDEDCKVK